VKQLLLEKLPPVLLVQLKRFAYTNEGAVKITKHVEFPDVLEIAEGGPVLPGADPCNAPS
jgi:hypothetical protein